MNKLKLMKNTYSTVCDHLLINKNMISPNEAFEYELYFEYLKDPDSVSPSWREYFRSKYQVPANPDLQERSIVR